MGCPVILCGIAFASGCLLTLAVVLSIHKRAARLTAQRNVATTPVSAVDIRAERDRSRTQFAGAIRRLEVSVAELRTKCTSQSAGVGRQAAEIDRLEAALRKCASQSAEIGRQASEIQRLETELKKRAALISVLRVRGQAQHALT